MLLSWLCVYVCMYACRPSVRQLTPQLQFTSSQLQCWIDNAIAWHVPYERLSGVRFQEACERSLPFFSPVKYAIVFFDTTDGDSYRVYGISLSVERQRELM